MTCKLLALQVQLDHVPLQSTEGAELECAALADDQRVQQYNHLVDLESDHLLSGLFHLTFAVKLLLLELFLYSHLLLLVLLCQLLLLYLLFVPADLLLHLLDLLLAQGRIMAQLVLRLL